MFSGITLGQYIPGRSLIHRLDPRVKIFATILFIVSVFFVKSFLWYGAHLVYLAAVIGMASIPPMRVLKGLKPMAFIIVLTVGLNVFITPGQIVWSWGALKITREGLELAGFMTIRLILLISGTSLLTFTTSPMKLTDGIESLLSPLKRIGFPAHEIAMMISIALRFIPTLFEEAQKIMNAQKARGADFESGNVLKRAQNLVPLLVPLFVNAFHRADELATAMEARCYRGGENRTRLNPLVMKRCDWAVVAASMVFFGSVILSGWM